MDALWAGLKQRKLFQWGLAYLGGAWLLLQLVSLLAEPFGWPALTAVRVTAVLLAVGLFAALVLAWYHGERGEQRVSGVELVMLAGILVVAGVAVSLARPGRRAAETVVAAPAPVTDDHSIAVLPLVNESPDPDNAYFAAGIHDELLTALSRLGDLKVISRASVMQYVATQKPLKQIAAELGVGVILEGTVRRAGKQVRVNANLIDPRTGEHLWSQQYDGDLTDVFAIQSDIAQKIAGALEARLSAGEKAGLERKPTRNAEAYDLYLRAGEYDRRRNNLRADYEAAVRLYQRALALDPDFALAHAHLSMVHGKLRWYAYDLGRDNLAKIRAEAERALQLQPDLPESHLAMGYYYYRGLRDYEHALQEFATALRGSPNGAAIRLAIANVHRRQGKLQQAIAEQKAALTLDPRDGAAYYEIGNSYHFVRQYADAVDAFDRALELAPDDYAAASLKGWTFLRWSGTVDTLAAAVRAFPNGLSGGFSADLDRFQLARLRRDRDGALRAAESAPEPITLQVNYYPRALLLAWARRDLGDTAAARAEFGRARLITAAAIQQSPDEPRLYVALGYALAGLGRHAEATAAARHATRLLPIARDAMDGPQYTVGEAAILSEAGDRDAALAEIRRALSVPGKLSTAELKLDPRWDPLRGDPRFQKLLQAAD